MAEETDKTPIAAAEPPKANPLAHPMMSNAGRPAPVTSLKPGLKLPTQNALKPGLKPGLKLPTQNAMRPGLKLPTQNMVRPGVKLPAKPVIRKPGATVIASPLPKPAVQSAKPVTPVPAAPAAPAAAAPVSPVKPVAAAPVKPVVPAPVKPAAPAAAAPVSPVKPVAAAPVKPAVPAPIKPVAATPVKPVVPAPIKPVAAAPVKPVVPAPVKPVAAAPAAPVMPKPIAVDAQGVGKLPTVAAKAVARDDAKPVASANPKPMEALKSVTQKLKGITQEIPQQAILRKTGIIAEGAMSEAQKEAAKHKTARISLSDAMGVAPVKNENAPMKTIRIKRPIDIPGATASLASKPKAEGAADAADAAPKADGATITQRKTLKISRPGGGLVRPSGKFGVKRPDAPAADAATPAGDVPAVADIPGVAELPVPPVPVAVKAADEGPAWLWALSTLVQLAACVAIGALAWFLYTNTQTQYF